MSLLLSGILLTGVQVQDSAYDLLIDRLRWNEPEDREQAAAKLASAGTDVAPHLERALAKAKDPEVIARIEQVKSRIRLKLHTAGLDEGFSPGYRKAAAEIILNLRDPSRDTILDAVESTTGYHVSFDPLLGRLVPSSGPKLPEATPADAALVFRIALGRLPIRDDSAHWQALKVVLCCFTLPKTATLMEDCLVHLDDPDQHFRVALASLSEYGQRRRHIPAYLRLVESAYADVARNSAFRLQRMNPGEYADRVATLLPRQRASLIESLSRTGDERWKEQYLKHVEFEDLAIKGAALKALATIDTSAAIPHVVRMLNSADKPTRMAGIHAVPVVPDSRISGALKEIILTCPDEQAAQQALFPFFLCPPEDARAVLEKAASHSADGVRRTASSFLRHLKQASDRSVAGRSLLVDVNDPACAAKLLEFLETENEQAAMSDLMKTRCPKIYEDLLNLELAWPSDRYPTVKEVLESAKEAMKARKCLLEWNLAGVDERPRIRRNSPKIVVASLFWLIPSTLGHEYGWYLEEGKLSLHPIDEARSKWKDWVRTK